jgi:hypothetical protein
MRSDLESLRALLEATVVSRPLAATATAAGIGFVLGGGLSRPMLGLLIQTGSRVAATWLGDAIRPLGPEPAEATVQEDR